MTRGSFVCFLQFFLEISGTFGLGIGGIEGIGRSGSENVERRTEEEGVRSEIISRS